MNLYQSNKILLFRVSLKAKLWLEYIHCRVPDKEWSFQDGGLYIIKKGGVKILTIIVLYRLS